MNCRPLRPESTWNLSVPDAMETVPLSVPDPDTIRRPLKSFSSIVPPSINSLPPSATDIVVCAASKAVPLPL